MIAKGIYKPDNCSTAPVKQMKEAGTGI